MGRKYIDIENGIPFDLPLSQVEIDVQTSGKIIKINAAQWNFKCCDCSLVHNVVIIPSKTKIKILMERDNRATAQLRRKNK